MHIQPLLLNSFYFLCVVKFQRIHINKMKYEIKSSSFLESEHQNNFYETKLTKIIFVYNTIFYFNADIFLFN